MDIVVLFPSFDSVDIGISLLKHWGVKNTTGRPFILCEIPQEVGDKIRKLLEVDPWIEVIPAHIMTPEGIFGSRNNINSFEEIFGEIPKNIHAVETGLSADVEILSLIPELDNFTLISCGDLHSSGFQMVGRESTVLSINQLTYKEIISAIRKNKIAYTVEFPPSEGKYFLTGHRGDKPGHNGEPCYYSPLFSPPSKICPICKKRLNIGVLERALELQKIQGGKRKLGELKPDAKPFIRVVPLFEILTKKGMGEREYLAICREFGNELRLWENKVEEVESKLSKINFNPEIVEAIVQVKKGDYSFNPPGYDGVFGELKLGEYLDIFQVKREPLTRESQISLF
ncbi:MAG: endonuclease Q family protein [Candidatus Omnitrophica bacterium]|nr:endonuclease Q family protein [Candidatus Omnitrophota bacterium]